MAHLLIVREAVSCSFRVWRLWLIQFFANPILFLLVAGWLLIPVAKEWQLVLNALLVIAIVAAGFVLHAGTLNYFHDVNRSGAAPLRTAFLRALRNLLPIFLWAAVLYLLWILLDKADTKTYQESVPAYVRSTLPVFLRRYIRLSFLTIAFEGLVFGVRWILVPGLLLPLLLRAADLGFRGFGKEAYVVWKRAVWSLPYWLILVVAALVGVFATTEIMALTPDFRTSTLRYETISMVVRLSLAYIMGLSSWMLTCSLLGRLGNGAGRAGDEVFRQAEV